MCAKEILAEYLKNKFTGRDIYDFIDDLDRMHSPILNDILNNYPCYEDILLKSFPKLTEKIFVNEYLNLTDDRKAEKEAIIEAENMYKEERAKQIEKSRERMEKKYIEAKGKRTKMTNSCIDFSGRGCHGRGNDIKRKF